MYVGQNMTRKHRLASAEKLESVIKTPEFTERLNNYIMIIYAVATVGIAVFLVTLLEP